MPQSETYASVLAIHALHAEVRLGVGEEERSKPQTVVIDVKLFLPDVPAAASRDTGDYICYHTISEKIHALCAAQEYRLIEYLVHAIHHLLRELVPKEVKITIKLRKPQIMLPYVKEGASYSFSDLPASPWAQAE